MKHFKKYKCLMFKKKWRKLIYAVFFAIILLLAVLYYLPSQNRYKFNFWNLMFNREVYFNLPERIVHLDLKGAPPKVAYYETLFPFLARVGVTGLLIEYEDMFPYAGKRSVKIPAYNAYSVENIDTILRLAKENGLSVIPLVQVFGHMEFVLKLKEFAQFREVRRYPQMICPTHQTTPEIILEMVDEVIKSHPNIDRLHIGADEVMYLGECDRCRDYIRANNISINDLFLRHISNIVSKIKAKYPSLRILMWDDHFRTMTIDELHNSRIGHIVEPVVWNYHKDIEQRLDMWERYEQVFSTLWIASAFKGATGPKQVIPDVSHHVANHKSWLRILHKYKDRIKFNGIILTGWQRYDHFAVLCELLPVAIPSLAICLQSLQIEHFENPTKFLSCDGTASSLRYYCYPGSNVYDAIMDYQQLKSDLETLEENSKVCGWMDNYNMNSNYSNTYIVEQISLKIDDLHNSLLNLKTTIYDAMSTVYDNFTINEWSRIFVKPLSVKIKSLLSAKAKLLNREYWPKRPLLDVNDEL